MTINKNDLEVSTKKEVEQKQEHTSQASGIALLPTS